MNYHIVRNDERISDIARVYNLSIDEIESINTHIRSWDKLIPGTKLRLPAIPEQVRLEVDDKEPFIEDYYPKISPDQIKVQNFKVNEAPNKPVNVNEVPSMASNAPVNIIPNVNPESQPPMQQDLQGAPIPSQPNAAPKPPTSKPMVPPKPIYPYYPYYYPYYPYYGYPNYPYNYGTRKR